MSKAVRFDDYGGIEVLEVREVARPEPGPHQVLVAVRAAGINPSEAKIRAGLLNHRDLAMTRHPCADDDLGASYRPEENEIHVRYRQRSRRSR
jgi:hypothetical protein